MNYSGKFGSLAPGSHSGEHFNFDAAPHRGDGNTVTIPDAHLLFSGDYSRSGTDLIVSDQFYRVVVPNYFHGDKRPTLVSPEGAPLDPSVIEALTGHVQYAQAGGVAAAGKVVGHVVKMTGSASIVRNGVTITLNNGDAVYQNDVVQTGSGSTLGLVHDRRHHLQPDRRRAVDAERPDLRSQQHLELVAVHPGAGCGQLRRRPGRQDRRHEGRDARSPPWASAAPR